MANIINITDYFDGGELNVAGTDTDPIQEKLNDFILKYEGEYLEKALGYPLSKLFRADNYPTPGTPRFQDLLNGKEFTDNRGFTCNWIGLKVANRSPIADYIWYWFTRDNASFSAVMGEVKGNAENAAVTSVMTKQCRAWNEMVDITRLLWQFLQANASVYPEFDINQVDACAFRKINVLNI